MDEAWGIRFGTGLASYTFAVLKNSDSGSSEAIKALELLERDTEEIYRLWKEAAAFANAIAEQIHSAQNASSNGERAKALESLKYFIGLTGILFDAVAEIGIGSK